MLRAREVVAVVGMALLASLRDIVGLLSFGVVLFGVWEVAGRGWACIAAGAPLAIGYAWRSTVEALRRPS
jgi:hypothetical protein